MVKDENSYESSIDTKLCVLSCRLFRRAADLNHMLISFKISCDKNFARNVLYHVLIEKRYADAIPEIEEKYNYRKQKNAKAF